MTIWKKKTDISKLNQQSKNTMMEYLDIKFIEIGNNYLIAKMPFNNKTRQPFGLLHGGASVSLAESVASLAANLCVEENYYAVGLEINANHIKAVKSGEVTAKATPIHLGKNTQVWSIKIKQNNNITCYSRMTAAIVKL